VLREYGVDDRLLLAVKSLYNSETSGASARDGIFAKSPLDTGVSRLDGARGKEQDWRPMFEPEVFWE